MRKILSLLGAITLVGTTSTNVVACGGGDSHIPFKEKIDLNTKINKLRTNILFNSNEKNKNLDQIILNDFYLLILIKKLVNPEIKYFSDAQAKTDVSNQNQKAGDLYVVITADINDANYQGSTNPIKICLKQFKLDDIKNLNGLNLTADINRKFEDFNVAILNNNVFTQKPILFSSTEVIYYEDNPISEINSDNSQRSGDFWIIIKANFSEPNWYGETPKIKINIK